MKIFLIGAAGAIGRRLSVASVAQGDTVTGMHRKLEQGETIRSTGATPHFGDLTSMDVADLVRVFQGHDAVVFAAGTRGAGIAQDTAVDLQALQKAADAAEEAGVDHFVLVSVFPDAGRGRFVSETFEHHIALKREADAYLAQTDLSWLIIRPGKLTDEAGTGLITAGPAVTYGQVSRDNVAKFISGSLHQTALRRTIVEITDGSVPIEESIQRLPRLRL